MMYIRNSLFIFCAMALGVSCGQSAAGPTSTSAASGSSTASVAGASSASAETHHPTSTGPAADQKLFTLEPRTQTGSVRLPGILLPFQEVQLYPKVSGFVKSVYVDRGSKVASGEVLIKMEAPEMEDRIAAAHLKCMEAEAGYTATKDKFNRMKVISRTPGTVSAYDLEAAGDKVLADSAIVQGALSEYHAAIDMDGYLTVSAPFSGIITERDIHPGALVGPGTQPNRPMLVLQEQSRLRLTVNIPEQYTAQFKEGAEVHFAVNALPGSTFTGKVTRASGSLNDNFRSETIEVDVLNPRGTFKPGMYAEVVIPVDGNAKAFIVPKSAVVTTTERKYVVRSEAGQARWVDISQGNEQGDSLEVFGDLHPGDQILPSADYTIQQGSKLFTH
jgi:membrane fusion protein, multidrug efflux system